MEVLHWISVRYNNALYSMNTEFVIMVKILLDAKFSGIPLIESFCMNDYIARLYPKNICIISSGRFDEPILTFPYLISLIKYP